MGVLQDLSTKELLDFIRYEAKVVGGPCIPTPEVLELCTRLEKADNLLKEVQTRLKELQALYEEML